MASNLQNRRRLLVVTYHFPPIASAGVFRVSGLIRNLEKSGWDIDVLTVRDSPFDTHDPSTLDLLPPDLTVTRTRSFDLSAALLRSRRTGRAPAPSPAAGTAGNPTGVGGAPARRRSGVLRRLFRGVFHALVRLTSFPDRRVGWTLPLMRAAWAWLSRNPGAAVLSSTPPHSTHLALAFLKPLRRFHWVVDFRDPWTAPMRLPKRRVMSYLNRALESWVLRRADIVVANTPGNRDALLESFQWLDPGKVVTITNGFDPADVGDTASDGAIDADIVYFGEIYPRMLALYLDALSVLRSRGAAVPRLKVYGLMSEDDRARVRERGLEDSIEFMGAVPYRESLALMKRARALLLLLPAGDVWRTCVPSKLYPYLFADARVLALGPEGDASRILTETGRGVTISSEDPEHIADAITAFFAETPATVEPSIDSLAPYTMQDIAARFHTILGGAG